MITRNAHSARGVFCFAAPQRGFSGPFGPGPSAFGPLRGCRARRQTLRPSGGVCLASTCLLAPRFARRLWAPLMMPFRHHFAVTALHAHAAAQQHMRRSPCFLFIIDSTRAVCLRQTLRVCLVYMHAGLLLCKSYRRAQRARVAFPSEKQPCGLPFGLRASRKGYFLLNIIDILLKSSIFY